MTDDERKRLEEIKKHFRYGGCDDGEWLAALAKLRERGME